MRNLLLTSIILATSLSIAHAAPKKEKYSFSAKSYLIANQDGSIIKEKNTQSVMPIASISKLMLSTIVVEQNMDENLYISDSRPVQSSIPKGTNWLPRRELLKLALVKSDNLAALILCNNIDNCVDRMNARAKELGMASTEFHEPTGLDSRNVSTANDLLKLLISASTNPLISEFSSMPTLEINAAKPIKVRNTNPFTQNLNVTLSKTGFTVPAGGCLVMILHSALGSKIYILLGSKNAKSRIPDMERLIKSE